MSSRHSSLEFGLRKSIHSRRREIESVAMRRWQSVLLALGVLGAIVLEVSHLTNLATPIAAPERESDPYSPEPITATSRASDVPPSESIEPARPQQDRVKSDSPAPGRSGSPCSPDANLEEAGECLGRWLSMRFESESRDENWANATERIVVDGLTQISGVTTVTSLTVDCRETVCRLQMAFPSRDYVPTQGPPERDAALVSDVFVPLLERAGLRRLIVPYPRRTDLPERTYYFVRN